MSLPALRQPKFITNGESDKKTNVTIKLKINDIQYVIITLKGEKKVVIPSDAYHGITPTAEGFKCVFCSSEIERLNQAKDAHKVCLKHRKVLETYPHLEEFEENLLRKLTKEDYYCSICNVVVAAHFVSSHIRTEPHKTELQRALMRASTYMPCK